MITFNDLKIGCEAQKQIRNCEREGMIFDWESSLKTMVDWGIITSAEEEELLAILGENDG
jgi:hypothetical protein